MSEPKKNVYNPNCKINNWVEEQAARQAIIASYLELKQKGDIKAKELEEDLNNIMQKVDIAAGAKLVFPGDLLIGVIHAENFPLCISSDVRFPHYDYRYGYVTSLSKEISNAKRHTFELVKIGDFSACKIGNQAEQNLERTKRSNLQQGTTKDQPLKFGDKFYLLVDNEMIGYALKERPLERYALAVTKVVGSPKAPVVVGPLSKLGNEAEFIVEDFQFNNRLFSEGKPVPYGYPCLLRHVLTGQCIGCDREGPIKFNLDIKSEEFQIVCKSHLNENKVENQNNCFTFCCDTE